MAKYLRVKRPWPPRELVDGPIRKEFAWGEGALSGREGVGSGRGGVEAVTGRAKIE